MPKPKRADDVFKILRKFDPKFEIWIKGKGSHRSIYHPEKGAAFPVPYHKGEDLRQGMLKAIIRRFNLPKNIFG